MGGGDHGSTARAGCAGSGAAVAQLCKSPAGGSRITWGTAQATNPAHLAAASKLSRLMSSLSLSAAESREKRPAAPMLQLRVGMGGRRGRA